MIITKGKQYRIRGNSEYFKRKYGTSNPVIEIEGLYKEVCGRSWADASGNPGAMLFGMRLGMEMPRYIIPTDDEVYYGHIRGLGELVIVSELEEIPE